MNCLVHRCTHWLKSGWSNTLGTCHKFKNHTNARWEFTCEPFKSGYLMQSGTNISTDLASLHIYQRLVLASGSTFLRGFHWPIWKPTALFQNDKMFQWWKQCCRTPAKFMVAVRCQFTPINFRLRFPPGHCQRSPAQLPCSTGTSSWQNDWSNTSNIKQCPAALHETR